MVHSTRDTAVRRAFVVVAPGADALVLHGTAAVHPRRAACLRLWPVLQGPSELGPGPSHASGTVPATGSLSRRCAPCGACASSAVRSVPAWCAGPGAFPSASGSSWTRRTIPLATIGADLPRSSACRTSV